MVRDRGGTPAAGLAVAARRHRPPHRQRPAPVLAAVVRVEGETGMGKVVVSQFITMDGVVEDPGGSEGFARGGWAFRFERGQEGDRFKFDEAMASEALLLGRVTYEGFATAWSARTGEF